jgi:purine-binding chemotaxis protein CheW
MTSQSRQFSTFYIGARMYGIEVTRVQEITKALPMAPVPLAPRFVHGLINLRGQISIAIGLRELFEISEPSPSEQMNVVCKLNEVLVSFLVDRIGDVMELESKAFEPAPETIPEEIRRFVEGVYKIPGALLSVIDVDRVAEYFLKSNLTTSNAPHASGTASL